MSSALTVQDQNTRAPIFQIATLSEAVEFSAQMAKANLMPAHLKGSPADCLRIVLQASRWEMDPFAVAEKTSVITGKLMYEGQLVSAVVNSRGKLKKRLSYDFAGDGTSRVLTVSGTISGEDEPRTITLTHAQACRINKNGQMQANPDQQMCYIGARLWARRHTPELMLGVYTPDEMPDGDNDDPQNVTGTGDQPAAPARAAAPQRSPKGAAAAVANAKAQPAEAAIDIQASSAAAPKPYVPMKSSEDLAMEAMEASRIAYDAKKASAAAQHSEGEAVEAVKLKDGDEITIAAASIKEFVCKEVNKTPNSVVAQIEGLPNKIYHIGGGDNPAWQIKEPVRVTLLGKAVKSQPGNIVGLVQRLSLATTTEEI